MSRRSFRVDVAEPRPASAWALVGVASATLWVTEQLRLHAASRSWMSFGDQLLADAALSTADRPTRDDAIAAGERMERNAPW